MTAEERLRSGVVEMILLARRLQDLSLAIEREAVNVERDGVSNGHANVSLGQPPQMHAEASHGGRGGSDGPREAVTAPTSGMEAVVGASMTAALSELAEQLQSLSLATEREAVQLRAQLDDRSDLMVSLETQLAELQRELDESRAGSEELKARLASSEASTVSLQEEADQHRNLARAAQAEAERWQAEATAATSRLLASQREREAIATRLAQAEHARDTYVRRLRDISTTGLGQMARSWLRFRSDHPQASRVILRSMTIPRTIMRLITARRPRQHPLFDAEWYLEANPGVRGYRLGPWLHYLRHGRREGRAPNAYFDPAWYLERYPDVRRSGIDPLDHYYRYGCWEGRDPSPRFDTDDYLARHPELKQARLNPLMHFLAEARRE